MKKWLLFFLCLFSGPCAWADSKSYQAIYQMRPSITGHVKAYTKVLPFYIDDINEDMAAAAPDHNWPIRDFLSIDQFDLNNDGMPEVFVELGSSVICGAKGCGTDIFTIGKNGELRQIGHRLLLYKPLVLSSQSHGYHDLAQYWLETHETGIEVVEQKFYDLYRYDGIQYQKIKRLPFENIITKGIRIDEIR